MIRNLLCFLLLTFFVAGQTQAQNTVGLLSYKPWKSYDGYNLIYPHNQPNVYLLNNCGEIVHIWEDDTDFRPGNTAYLMEDGRIVKTKRPASIANDPIWAGGGGATIEIRDWDNNLEWSFTLNDSLDRLHHDIEVMPNGNILAIVWEKKTMQEAIDAGRDPNLLVDGELWPDYIIELDPVADEIVWEWHAWDHLIQDFDPSKANYGVVADNPNKINLNYTFQDGVDDWLHTNAIDYNFDNDQIVISVPTFSEIWVIDHTTTTAEAAGSTGGESELGGDLMYRWGNPQAYDKGTADDQQLFYQHDIHWIDDHLELGQPYLGYFGVFNNRVGEDYSTVNVFDGDFDMYDWQYPIDDGLFGPQDFELTITHPEPTEMYSTGLSSAQWLPNGNVLICTGRFGYSFEITPDNEIVWEYKTPLNAGAPAAQGDTLEINNNLTFRMHRYPPDYEAFEGKDLTPMGYLETNPNEDFCQNILPTTEVFDNYKLRVFPNPATDMFVVDWEAGMKSTLSVIDVMGRTIYSYEALGGRKYLDVSGWEAGVYFIQIDGVALKKFTVMR